MQFLKFVNNKTVLLDAISLLQDKDVASEVFSSPESPNETSKRVDYSRVCDQTMLALRARFDPPPVEARYEPPRRFTDAELNSAFEKYKTVVAALPD